MNNKDLIMELQSIGYSIVENDDAVVLEKHGYKNSIIRVIVAQDGVGYSFIKDNWEKSVYRQGINIHEDVLTNIKELTKKWDRDENKKKKIHTDLYDSIISLDLVNLSIVLSEGNYLITTQDKMIGQIEINEDDYYSITHEEMNSDYKGSFGFISYTSEHLYDVIDYLHLMDRRYNYKVNQEDLSYEFDPFGISEYFTYSEKPKPELSECEIDKTLEQTKQVDKAAQEALLEIIVEKLNDVSGDKMIIEKVDNYILLSDSLDEKPLMVVKMFNENKFKVKLIDQLTPTFTDPLDLIKFIELINK